MEENKLRKSREELAMDAKALGMDLSYMPEILVENIFKMGQKDWELSMKNGIGSSSACAAIGKSPYKTAAEVALEKAYGKVKPLPDDPETQYRLNSGHMQEVPLLKWYAACLGYVVALTDPENPATSDIKDVTEITQKEWDAWEGKGVVCVDHARYRHPQYPFMFIDMDGVCFTPEREMYVLECKTADAGEFKWNWKSGVWGDGKASVGNLGYIDQARQHMCVSNSDRVDIIAACDFNANNNVIVTIYRDMAEEKKLIDAECKLWNQVETGEIPSFTMLSDRSYDNIAYIITPEVLSDEPIAVDEKYRSVIGEIMKLQKENDDLKASMDKNDERVNTLKIDLLQYMGSHALAIMPSVDGYEYRLEIKSRVTNTFDSKRFKLEHPDIAAGYNKTTVGDKKLSIKESKIKKAKN